MSVLIVWYEPGFDGGKREYEGGKIRRRTEKNSLSAAFAEKSFCRSQPWFQESRVCAGGTGRTWATESCFATGHVVPNPGEWPEPGDGNDDEPEVDFFLGIITLSTEMHIPARDFSSEIHWLFEEQAFPLCPSADHCYSPPPLRLPPGAGKQYPIRHHLRRAHPGSACHRNN